MNESLGNPKLNAQVLEEASAWFVEFSEDEVRASARRGFNQWLRASPEHVRAYLQISALWEEAPLLQRSRNHSADELIERARAGSNVVALDAAGRVDRHATVLARRPAWILRGHYVLIAASILIVATGLALWQQFVRGTYATSMGEQRSITLVDGSTIELNARSRVRVAFTATERAVDLLEGQALFHVAKDPARAFVVRSDGTRVRAVGTQFDVNRTRAGTIVTVVEGRVAVLALESGSERAARVQWEEGVSGRSLAPGGNSTGTAAGASADRTGQPTDSTPMYLIAGEQVTVTAHTSRRRAHTDSAGVTAWRQRKLEFSSSPLTEVADEYNRYHNRRLIVRDPRLENFHISGVFSATDSASLVAFLRQQPNLNVRETDSEIEITSQ